MIMDVSGFELSGAFPPDEQERVAIGKTFNGCSKMIPQASVYFHQNDAKCTHSALQPTSQQPCIRSCTWYGSAQRYWHGNGMSLDAVKDHQSCQSATDGENSW